MKKHTILFAALVLGLFSIHSAYAQKTEWTPNEAIENSKDDKEKGLTADMEKFAEAISECLQEKDMEKSSQCMLAKIKQLADEGNILGEHALGNYYEKFGDKEKAIEYYNKALKNPKMIDDYKIEVQKDLDRAKK